MRTELIKLKEHMYDILTSNDDQDNSNIIANHGMGVQLSNAIKKDGVTIIMQNVVNKKITNNVVKSLKLIDTIINSPQKIEEQKDHLNQISLEHLEQVISWLASKNISLKLFENIVRGMFCKEMLKRTGSSIKVADLIGSSQSTVSKLSRELDSNLELLGDTKFEKISIEE